MSNQKGAELKRKGSSAEIRALCSTLGSGLLKHGLFFLFSDQGLHIELRAVLGKEIRQLLRLCAGLIVGSGSFVFSVTLEIFISTSADD